MHSPIAQSCSGPDNFELNTSKVNAKLVVHDKLLSYYCKPRDHDPDIAGNTVLITLDGVWFKCSMEVAYKNLAQMAPAAIILRRKIFMKDRIPGFDGYLRGMNYMDVLSAARMDVPMVSRKPFFQYKC